MAKKKFKKHKNDQFRTPLPWNNWGMNNRLLGRFKGVLNNCDIFGRKIYLFEVIEGSIANPSVFRGQFVSLYSTKIFSESMKNICHGETVEITYMGKRQGEMYLYHMMVVIPKTYYLQKERLQIK